MAKVPVTFRCDETTLAKARERAGGSELLGEVLRKAMAVYAEGKWKPPELAEHVAAARALMKQALQELEH